MIQAHRAAYTAGQAAFHAHARGDPYEPHGEHPWDAWLAGWHAAQYEPYTQDDPPATLPRAQQLAANARADARTRAHVSQAKGYFRLPEVHIHLPREPLGPDARLKQHSRKWKHSS